MSDHLAECPWRRPGKVLRCRCGPPCWQCGFYRHSAVHLPPLGHAHGSKPWGHEYESQPTVAPTGTFVTDTPTHTEEPISSSHENGQAATQTAESLLDAILATQMPRNCPAHFALRDVPCFHGCSGDLCVIQEPQRANALLRELSALRAQQAEPVARVIDIADADFGDVRTCIVRHLGDFLPEGTLLYAALPNAQS